MKNKILEELVEYIHERLIHINSDMNNKMLKQLEMQNNLTRELIDDIKVIKEKLEADNEK